MHVEQVTVERLERVFEDWCSGSLLAIFLLHVDEVSGNNDVGREGDSHIWSGASKSFLISNLGGECFEVGAHERHFGDEGV